VRNPEAYVAYSNSDDALSKEDRAKATSALNALMDALQQPADEPPSGSDTSV